MKDKFIEAILSCGFEKDDVEENVYRRMSGVPVHEMNFRFFEKGVEFSIDWNWYTIYSDDEIKLLNKMVEYGKERNRLVLNIANSISEKLSEN